MVLYLLPTLCRKLYLFPAFPAFPAFGRFCASYVFFRFGDLLFSECLGVCVLRFAFLEGLD